MAFCSIYFTRNRLWADGVLSICPPLSKWRYGFCPPLGRGRILSPSTRPWADGVLSICPPLDPKGFEKASKDSKGPQKPPKDPKGHQRTPTDPKGPEGLQRTPRRHLHARSGRSKLRRQSQLFANGLRSRSDFSPIQVTAATRT